jgi:uncharacterized protein (DUF885 family)
MKRLACFAACWVLALPSHPAHAATIDDSTALHALLDEQWQYRLANEPEEASLLGDMRYNNFWSDMSLAHVQADRAATAAFLARFKAIRPATLSEDDRLNRQLMLGQLQDKLRGIDLKLYEMSIYPWRSSTPLLLATHVGDFPFNNVQQYEDYLQRLHSIPVALEQTTEVARQGMRDHLMPPKYLLEKAALRIDAIADAAGEDNIFAQPLKRFPAGMPATEQARLRFAIVAAIDDVVRPAYRKLGTFVKQDYAPYGRSQPGLWQLPNGPAIYRYLVHQKTTTNDTPQQIHALGLAEVARIEASMTDIAHSLGYANLAAFRQALKSDPRMVAQSPEDLLQRYRSFIAGMEPALPTLFGLLPKGDLSVVPVEAFRETAAPIAEYHPGAPDGSRAAQVYVNTGNFAQRPTPVIESAAYHEGVPGHHLQISIAQTLPGLPPFRQQADYTAYVEGWGLYAERLGKDVGFYRDPVSDYGRLSGELLRAIRLVQDTGVHDRHWSRQQMLDFFHAHSDQDEGDIQAETDRYISLPGQALAYKVGQLKLLALREHVRKALGERFDLRTFHDKILGAGALPLDVLEHRIDAWIAESNFTTATRHVSIP